MRISDFYKPESIKDSAYPPPAGRFLPSGDFHLDAPLCIRAQEGDLVGGAMRAIVISIAWGQVGSELQTVSASLSLFLPGFGGQAGWPSEAIDAVFVSAPSGYRPSRRHKSSDTACAPSGCTHLGKKTHTHINLGERNVSFCIRSLGPKTHVRAP